MTTRPPTYVTIVDATGFPVAQVPDYMAQSFIFDWDSNPGPRWTPPFSVLPRLHLRNPASPAAPTAPDLLPPKQGNTTTAV